MWQLSPEQITLVKQIGQVVLFCVALSFFIVGGLLTAPADLGLIGAGLGVLGVVGIAKA